MRKLIAHAGSGSEANIDIELMTEFPGIGGKIITGQSVMAAMRKEFCANPKLGHRMFLRHMIIKKLDDLFLRKKIYLFPHIPRPLGSISMQNAEKIEACIYKWVIGSEGFVWEYPNPEGGLVVFQMEDWKEFCSAFLSAGIDLSTYCADADDGRVSKNVIHQFYTADKHYKINPLWQRIDFGCRSIRMDYEKLKDFLVRDKDSIKKILRCERYDMVILALEYLMNAENMDRLDIGRLDTLIGHYRMATLKHYISRGMGISETNALARIDDRKQSLV